MIRAAILAVALFGFWLLMSGKTTAWLVASGAVAALLVALYSRRAGAVDGEGFPAERILRGLLYWPWLVKEIAVSSLAVARIILSPRLPISPRLVTVPMALRTAAGMATYANSITLTPGTIALDLDPERRELTVHALTEAGAAALAVGDMGRRVARFEGRER